MNIYVWDCVDDGTYDRNGSVVLIAKDDVDAFRLFKDAFPKYGFYTKEMKDRTSYEAEFNKPHQRYPVDEARVISYTQGCDT